MSGGHRTSTGLKGRPLEEVASSDHLPRYNDRWNADPRNNVNRSQQIWAFPRQWYLRSVTYMAVNWWEEKDSAGVSSKGTGICQSPEMREDGCLGTIFLSKPFDGDTQVQAISESRGLPSAPSEYSTCLLCSVCGASQALRGIYPGPNPGLTSSLLFLKGS